MDNQNLLLRALEIRDEIMPAQNTANRVGQLFFDIIQNVETNYNELDVRYLRKDIPDTAHEAISFKKEIQSSAFIPGFLENSTGWQIDPAGDAWFNYTRVRQRGVFGTGVGSEQFISGFPNGLGWDVSSYAYKNAAEVEETKWRLEIDDIVVRGKLRVKEYIISQMRGENDNSIFSGMMKVDHYDPVRKRIYLQTGEGLLYNPFRIGDILAVQQYGGLPSAGNNYNVTKQYELRVTEVGIGSLLLGKKRLDWISFSHFVGEFGDIADGDVLIRLDSFSDSTRKGIVKITTIDEIGAPNIDVVYGLKTDPLYSTKVRMGNLTGIRSKYNVNLTGLWGLYAKGAVLEDSQVFMQNGLTIEQNFTVMNGELNSRITGVLDQMSTDIGNILRNSQFSENLYYWDISPTNVSVFGGDEGLIWVNRSYFSQKFNQAYIFKDGAKQVLKLKRTGISQNNQYFSLPEKEEEEGGEEAENKAKKYSFSFYYRALTDGVLKVGIPDSDLYAELPVTPSDKYIRFSLEEQWNGTGNFIFETDGEILIHSAALMEDGLANAVLKLETEILQTHEMIQLRATKDYVDAADGSIYIHFEGRFTVTAQEISSLVTEVNNINNTISTAGWITTSDGNTLYARKSMENGDYLIESVINQTATTIKIQASKVNLNGAITTAALAADVTALINGKASASDLSNYIPVGQVTAAMQQEGLIVGAYLKMSLIDVDNLYATSLSAVRGSIGSYTVSGNSIYSQFVSIQEDGISFYKDNIYAGFGTSSGPSVLGVPVPVWIDNTAANGEYSKYGIYVGVNNALNAGENYAICMAGGFVSGLALKPRSINANATLTHADVYVSCYNSASITVKLPANPTLGKLVFVRRCNTPQVTVDGNGVQIHNHATNKMATITFGSDGYTAMFFYDGQFWCYNVLDRNH